MKEDSAIKATLYKIASVLIPDAVFVRLKYRKAFGRWPNLKSPKTFNEKLTWLKLHDHNPLYTRMVDKYEAKKYVAEIIGEEYVIPTYSVWDSADDIDFDSLPDKFVMKATHDSGRVIICHDKSTLDKDWAREEMRKSLKRDFYAVTREWPYKNVKPRIIAEKLLELPDDEEPADYKVHNFNGTPEVILVCRDRFTETGLTEDFFDKEWKRLDVRRPGYPNSPVEEKIPEELEKMLLLSERLAKNYPFMRTDFYTIGDKIFFGEITLYPASASVPFVPDEFDDIFGNKLEIKDLEDKIRGDKLLIVNNIAILIKFNTNQSKDINDYKFFCFDGKVEFLKIDFDRSTDHKANYYDSCFNLMDFGETVCPPDFNRVFDRPRGYDGMISMASKLSKGFPFIRVDFYNLNGRIYFGELTFFPNSGNGTFTVPSADENLGEIINLGLCRKN